MHNTAGGVAVGRLRRSWLEAVEPRSWLPTWSPAAALRAVRASVVVAGLFAFTDQVIGNLQMATFAAFGSFATLVLVSFAGTRREKLLAHLGLAVAGSVLLTIGTAVTSSTALAALATVPVTFAVFFAGVTGPNAANGVTGALLAYVLPAASPGTLGMVPDRLAGWWLASVAGTVAVLVLSPPAAGDKLRAGASRLAVALAAQLEAALHGAADEDRLAGVLAAKRELIATFAATPYRPTGLRASEEALANCVELLEWCAALVADALGERLDLSEAPAATRELLEASCAVLEDVARLLAGAEARPDLQRLERARERSLAWLGTLPPDEGGFRELARMSFHAHTIATATLAIGADGLVVAGLADAAWIAAQRRAWYGSSAPRFRLLGRVQSVTTAARWNASLRSVWLVNSLRGAIALAAAVAVADLTSVQHGFWVVLGTLSVLRTNAASTGATALRALTGTVIGFVIGGALLVAIGTGSAALWIALPLAVFVAAYAPGTAPFAVGQAAFTVTVAVLFNLLQPVGWEVGVTRIEDVALGCAVSVLVGGLFWPRGVAAVVGDDLADAFRSGASYLKEAIAWASGLSAHEPRGATAASAAASRLEEALRGFLAERGSKRIELRELWRLVGGSLRLRLTARSIGELPGDAAEAGAAHDGLAACTSALAAWYERLAELLDRPSHGTVAALGPPALTAKEVSSLSPYGVWLREYLDHLSEHLGELVSPALRIAEVRRRPWWR